MADAPYKCKQLQWNVISHVMRIKCGSKRIQFTYTVCESSHTTGKMLVIFFGCRILNEECMLIVRQFKGRSKKTHWRIGRLGLVHRRARLLLGIVVAMLYIISNILLVAAQISLSPLLCHSIRHYKQSLNPSFIIPLLDSFTSRH